jgi:hypothetical protein
MDRFVEKCFRGSGEKLDLANAGFLALSLECGENVRGLML